jgi:hypothetical protein
MPDRFLNYEQKAGDPITVGDFRIVPFSQTLRVQFPGRWMGGLIWNRPASVLVTSREGQEQVLPVHDVTRRVQFSLLGACILVALLFPIIFGLFRKD